MTNNSLNMLKMTNDRLWEHPKAHFSLNYYWQHFAIFQVTSNCFSFNSFYSHVPLSHIAMTSYKDLNRKCLCMSHINWLWVKHRNGSWSINDLVSWIPAKLFFWGICFSALLVTLAAIENHRVCFHDVKINLPCKKKEKKKEKQRSKSNFLFPESQTTDRLMAI